MLLFELEKIMAQTINTFDDSKFYKTVDIMDVFPGSGYSTMLKILKREKVPYIKFTDSPRGRKWYSGKDLNKMVKFLGN